MTYLTPEDVQRRLGCGRVQARRLMREAGAWDLGRSLRISEEAWERWVKQRETGSTSGARNGERNNDATALPAAWSIAYAYRDVLSRGSAA